MKRHHLHAAAALLLALLAPACDAIQRDPPRLPTEAQARAFYQRYPDLESVTLNGNVVEVRIRQPARQLRRGGSLWARVGPYVYIFSPDTRRLLDSYAGVAGVRVITYAGGSGREVARALLLRDALSDILWRRSLNLLGHALRDGTAQPVRLEDLTQWGEEYTEFEYNPEYVK